MALFIKEASIAVPKYRAAHYDKNENNFMQKKTKNRKSLPVYLAVILILFSACQTDVDTIYEELNAPLGLSVEVYEDSYLISFYAYNANKHGFLGYSFYQNADLSTSRSLVALDESLFTFTSDDYSDIKNHDVDEAIRIKVGGSNPSDSDVFYIDATLLSGEYLTARAYPDYLPDYPDNEDPLLGPYISSPSNTVQIP